VLAALCFFGVSVINLALSALSRQIGFLYSIQGM
jgi:hypothetical protein